MRVGRSGIDGEGLFAEAPIARGEVISRFGGRLVTDAELRDLLTEAAATGTTSTPCPCSPTRPRPTGRRAPARGNHGCDPNTWWVDPCLVAARRDLDAGEELTLDYATITDDPEFAMECSCGSESCRGRVTGSDWRLPHLQAAYGPHWGPGAAGRIAGP